MAYNNCSCTALTSIATSCGETQVGGIRRVIVACAKDVTFGAPVDGEIDSITLESGAKTYQIAFRKQSSTFNSEMTIDDVTGVKFATTTAEIVVAKMNKSRLNAVRGLLASEVVAFVEDMNSVWYTMGVENVVTATAATMTTGTAATDANNVTITLTDIASTLPYTLGATAIATITDPATLEV